MALKIATGTKENLKLIVRQDGSIPEDLTDEEWNQYAATLDESNLRLIDEPTRFILQYVLPYDAQMKIQNAQLGYADGKPEIHIGYIMEEIRCSLVGIVNPPGCQSFIFRKDDDGYAAKELIADLAQYGLVMSLFSLRSAAMTRIYNPTKK